MAMDFFEHQDAARRKTGRLVILFILAVIGIIVALYFVFTAVMLYLDHKQGRPFDWWHPQMAMYVVGGTLAVVLLGSLYKTIQLGAGGRAVAQMLGGVPVEPGTRDPLERRLLNVVEEMAIASGVPVPAVYHLPQEGGINAFAAGTKPGDAVIGVTRGTMQQLTRDELQGVIAHEFSHILHGDMRLNLRLIAVLHGILLIGIIGYWILRVGGSGRSSRKKGGGQIALIGLGLLVIGYVGVFFGKLIKSAVSRQREFLADASAIKFTRNDWGLSGALKKIGGFVNGSRVVDPNAEQASHMFFGEAVSAAWFNAMATHPPLDERIRRIDPKWGGEFEASSPATPEQLEQLVAVEARRSPAEAAALGFDASRTGRARAAEALARDVRQAAEAGAARQVRVQDVLSRIGNPQQEHLEYAGQLRSSIPATLVEAARAPFSARAVIYALLLNREAEPRQFQFDRLTRFAEPAALRETRRLAGEAGALAVELRLPLVDLAVPALRQLTAEQYALFKDNVQHLIDADQRVDLFEYVLQRILLRHLAPQFEPRRRDVVQYHALKPLAGHCAALLSVLAHAGSSDTGEVRRAFGLARQRLRLDLELGDRKHSGLRAIDGALQTFATASPQIKKRVLDACVVCIAADGVTTVAEAELLRAVADALGCPVPPFLPGQEI